MVLQGKFKQLKQLTLLDGVSGLLHQQYGNLVSGFCWFSPVFWFPET